MLKYAACEFGLAMARVAIVLPGTNCPLKNDVRSFHPTRFTSDAHIAPSVREAAFAADVEQLLLALDGLAERHGCPDVLCLIVNDINSRVDRWRGVIHHGPGMTGLSH